MTTIAANEFGKVHVFRLSEGLAAEITQLDSYAGLAAALNATITQPDDVQILAADMVHDLGLAQFLMMGHGIDAAEITPHMDMLNALQGSVVIIRSGAFGGTAVTVPDQNDAKWIASFTEQESATAPFTPLTSDASQGNLPAAEPPARKPKSDARIGGMVATVALLVLFLLVGLMIWIAG